MLSLYPSICPYTSYTIQVDKIHNIYVEECGIKEGIPIVYLHGGPGSGCDEDNRRFFDPNKYRIILFDQRGAGRSRPHAELKNNNPQFLIKDLEIIREHCGVKKWVIFGGSWGSTLALLYAIAYPNRVNGMILRGIFLARQKDLDWLYKEGGASNIYPDYWQEFVSYFNRQQQKHLIRSYYKLLNGEDDIARMAAAKSWSKWEAVCANVDPGKQSKHHLSTQHIALSLSKIACHYAVNKYFIKENFILDNIQNIGKIPVTIIHGRYDMVCPIENAYALHQNWPKSNLIIIKDAGHSSRDPGIMHALIHVVNNFKLI